MTWYLRIKPVGAPPSDLGTDKSSGRAMYGFSVMAVKRESVEFEEELLKVLVDAAVGVAGETLFTSSSARIPDLAADGSAVMLIVASGGPTPEGVHDQPSPKYVRPTASFTARAGTTEQARAMAWAAYDALVAVVNQGITP